MARKRRTNPKKQRALDPEDVLAGRVEIQAAALFDLIHQVNPTHRGLSAPEAARRYETKSRLQSLLIRRFGDEHVELGPREPEPFPRRSRRSDELRAFTRFHTTFCHTTTGAANAGVMLRIAMLEGRSPADMRRLSRNFEADHRDDADARCEMCLALRQAGMDEEEVGQLTRLLVKDHPRHAGAALLMADLEAKDGRWEDVLRRLEGLDVTDLDDGRACHHHHLLGLSRLYLNRPKEALEVFETGSGHERGSCPLDSLTDLARALTDPLEAGDWDAVQPTIRQLVGAVRRADEALAGGDAAAARDALERPCMWSAEERQSAARLAAAYLELECATPNERFLKRHALAFYCHVARPDKPDLLEVVLPGMSWDEDRLIELGLRARAWLGDRRG